MSYMEIFSIDADGTIRPCGDANNSWGGAMLVWKKLIAKYGLCVEGASLCDSMFFKRLWNSCGKGILTQDEEILLRSTFDNVWVRRDAVPTLIQSMRQFHVEFVKGTQMARTLKEAAAVLERLLDITDESEVVGVCFNHTSVNADTWRYYGDEDDDDDDDTGRRMPNLKDFPQAWEILGREWSEDF